MDVLDVVDHHFIDERGVGASVADERVKVFPPTGLHWAAAATTTTRHRASTSMYSLTFCVRVMSSERHHWNPAVQAAAVRPPSRFFFRIPDGWKEISADIRLRRIIAISKKYG